MTQNQNGASCLRPSVTLRPNEEKLILRLRMLSKVHQGSRGRLVLLVIGDSGEWQLATLESNQLEYLGHG